MIAGQQTPESLVKPHTFFDEVNLGQWESIVLLKPGTTFSNESDFKNENTWLTKLQAGDLFMMHDVWKVEPNHKETEFQESILNFQYAKNSGKNRQRILFNKSIDTYAKYISFNYYDAQIMYFENGNLYGKLNSDGTIQGFETSTIYTDTLKLGQVNPVPYTAVLIELEDANELFNLQLSNIDWDFGSLERVPVTISNDYIIGSDASVIYFEVNDNEFDHPIYGLQASDFTINDNGGSVSIQSVELRNGTYKLSLSTDATDGTISIDSKYYYTTTSLGYNYVGVVDVTLSSIASNGRKELSVTVTRTTGGTPVTSLVKEDFEIDSGDKVIDTVTHEGAGVYTIVLFTDLANSGTVAVVDPVFQGSNSYTYTKLNWTMSIEALAKYKNATCIDVELLDTDSNRIEQGQYTIFDISNITISDEFGYDTTGNVYWIMFIELTGIGNGTLSFDNGDAQASTMYDYDNTLFFDNFITNRGLFLNGTYVGSTPQWMSQDMLDNSEITLASFTLEECFDLDVNTQRWTFNAGAYPGSDQTIIIDLPTIIEYDAAETYRLTVDIESISIDGNGFFFASYAGQGSGEWTTAGVKTFDVTPEDGNFRLLFNKGVNVTINSITIEKT